MRSPEQENFLEHRRFGEDEQSMARAKVDQIVRWISLLFLVAASLLHFVAFKRHGPFSVYGFILAWAVGTVLFIYGKFRNRS